MPRNPAIWSWLCRRDAGCRLTRPVFALLTSSYLERSLLLRVFFPGRKCSFWHCDEKVGLPVYLSSQGPSSALGVLWVLRECLSDGRSLPGWQRRSGCLRCNWKRLWVTLLAHLAVNTRDTRVSLLITSLHLYKSLLLLSVMCNVDSGEYSTKWRKEGTTSQKYLIIIQWNNFEHFCLLEWRLLRNTKIYI